MYGWICPKCGKIYGPNVTECYTCNAQKLNWSVTFTSVALNDYENWKNKEEQKYYGKHSEE